MAEQRFVWASLGGTPLAAKCFEANSVLPPNGLQRQKWSFSPLLLQLARQSQQIKIQSELAFIQGEEFNSQTSVLSFLMGFFLLFFLNDPFCHKAVSLIRNRIHSLIPCRPAGSTLVPQSSGNGPDGSHPPVPRSPMAQDRGMCVCHMIPALKTLFQRHN